MKICHTCGVELEDSPDSCPLCGANLLAGEGDSRPTSTGTTGSGAVAGAPGPQAASPRRQRPPCDDEQRSRRSAPEETEERKRARFWLWEMFTIVIVAIAIIVAATDFAYGFDVSWSAYPLSSLAFIWLLVSSVVALRRELPLAYCGAGVSVLLYLFVLDILVPGPPWFIGLALPIALLVGVMGGGALGIVRGFKFSLFQTLATAVVLMGLSLVGLQIILYFAIGTESILSWSIVAFGGCLSIALLLWIINKRLRERHADFKRVFHL